MEPTADTFPPFGVSFRPGQIPHRTKLDCRRCSWSSPNPPRRSPPRRSRQIRHPGYRSDSPSTTSLAGFIRLQNPMHSFPRRRRSPVVQIRIGIGASERRGTLPSAPPRFYNRTSSSFQTRSRTIVSRQSSRRFDPQSLLRWRSAHQWRTASHSGTSASSIAPPRTGARSKGGAESS